MENETARKCPHNTHNSPDDGLNVNSEDCEDGSRRIEILFSELQSAGVSLFVEDGRLAFDAPDGAMSDALLARVRSCRDELLEWLQNEQAPENSGRVVHCKRAEFDVYVGRPSPWGNPFEIGRDGTRADVIEKYRAWIVTQDKLLAKLPELRGKVLGCYCAPLACHGDVLVHLANGLVVPVEPEPSRKGDQSAHEPTGPVRPILTKDSLVWERVARRKPGEPDSDWPAEYGDFVIKVYSRKKGESWEWIGRRPCCQDPACGCRKKRDFCLHNFGQVYAISSPTDERMPR